MAFTRDNGEAAPVKRTLRDLRGYIADHGEDFRQAKELIDAEMQRLRLGATGRYPDCHYGKHDEGEIQFAVAADVPNQKLLINFGKPVHCLGMTPEQAQGLIDLLQSKVWELRGIK